MEDSELFGLQDDFNKLRLEQQQNISNNKDQPHTAPQTDLTSSTSATSNTLKNLSRTSSKDRFPLLARPPCTSPAPLPSPSSLQSWPTFGNNLSLDPSDFSSLSLSDEPAKSPAPNTNPFNRGAKLFVNRHPPMVASTAPHQTDLLTCSQQARMEESDITADELAGYLETILYLPRNMSPMAEMMYT